jgi:4-amino-4-deoxy-L-arabinose transferase-like glycosyltransferase
MASDAPVDQRSSRVTTLWTVAALAVLAVVARIAYWLSTRDAALDADALQYHLLATNVADGKGISDTFPSIELHATAYRPPVYPLLLGGWYRVFGTGEGIGRGFAVVIGVALVVTTYLVVRRHAETLVATSAAVLVAIFPPLVANDTVPLTESTSLILILLLVDAVLNRKPVLAGVWCGLLTLTRPSAQLLILFVVAWLWVKLGWRRALVAALLFAVVLTPWLVRNAVQLGRPVLVTSNGFNLAAMHSDEAREAGGFVDPVYHPGFDDMRLLQFDELEWDDALRSRALEDIRRSPGHVLTVAGRNFVAIFELDPSTNRAAEQLDGRNLTVRTWTLPLFYVVLVAGIAGLWVARKTELAKLLVAIAVYFTIASLAFVAPPRLRAPVDLVLCIGVGLLISQLWSRRGARGGVAWTSNVTERAPG